MNWGQIPQFMISGLTSGSIYALAAIGFNLIYNSTNIINFAQGEFIMLGGLIMVTFYAVLKLPLIIAAAITIGIVTLIGALIERVAIHPVRHSPVLNLIVITIGISIILSGAAMLIWGKEAQFYSPFTGGINFRIGKVSIASQTLWVLGLTLLMGLFLWSFFGRTVLGKAIRACSENREAARSIGINVERMILLSFGISAGIGAFGGIIITPITLMEFNSGTIIGLKGFCALIVGGLGSNLGAIIGGFLLGISESLAIGFISSSLKDAIAFLMLLMVLFIKPTGIIGRRR